MKAGDQIGRLTLATPCRLGRYAAWECRCSCGTYLVTRESSLRAGFTKSCGCWQKEVARARIEKRSGNQALHYKHGDSPAAGMTPEYKAFHHAKARCTNPNTEYYYRYGARGIEFRFSNFGSFLAEVGRRPSSKYSLDRINNDGHYEPGNVRWADPKTQANNRAARSTK